MKLERNGDSNCNWRTWNGPRGLRKVTERVKNRRKNWYHPSIALLRSTRILKRFLMTWGDFLSLRYQWKTISLHWCGKLVRSIIIMIIITSQILNFAISADHRVKLMEGKKRINAWTLLGNWKTVEYDSDGDTTCNWSARYNHREIGAGTGGLGNKRTNWDHPNYIIAEIGQNTEKSPGDLLSLRLQWKIIS